MSYKYALSILIPAKDEAQRLPTFLNKVLRFSEQFPEKNEIIVIDDGSSDRTSEIVLELSASHENLKLLRLPLNKGKGFAIKSGIASSQGSIVAFSDADGSTPIEEIERHWNYFSENIDIVIGSRVLKDDASQVDALIYRRAAGAVFNFMVHRFLMDDFKDTQCGFKMFRREAAVELASRQRLDGFGFDMEFLYLAKHLGMKLKEVPVSWHHVNGSKVSLLRDSWRMFLDIFQIRTTHPLPLESSSAAEISQT